MEIPELYPRDIATTRAARLHQGAGQKGEAAPGRGRVHEGEWGKAYGRAMMGPLVPMPLTGDPKPVVEVSNESEAEHDASILDKNPEIDWELKSKHYNPYFIFWHIKKKT